MYIFLISVARLTLQIPRLIAPCNVMSGIPEPPCSTSATLVIYRLNYAIDLCYGVLLEIAKAVWGEKSIDLQMGYVNVIWQGDANEIALRSLAHCQCPPNILNVTGPETISIKWLAEQFGEKMGKTPVFVNQPLPTALLSNTTKANHLFGHPKVTLAEMIGWTTDWVKIGGDELGKPTHFQERSGKY